MIPGIVSLHENGAEGFSWPPFPFHEESVTVKAIIKELNQLSASGVCVAAWHDKQYEENTVLF